MHIRCPHCNNPIEVLDDTSLSDISCPSCGSGFNIVSDTPTRNEKPSGDTIGHFTLTEKLGFGAFGTVWKASDTELDRTVAIKIPRKDQLDAGESEQFLREARAAAQLKHPNIVAVHEVGKDETSGQLYIVSDFVDGITLADWITGQQPTADETAKLCQEIAEALHHAHQQGVIHRDLKPGNIMMEMVESPESRVEGRKDPNRKSLDSRPSTLDFIPHIMDFGIAKRVTGEITMTVEGKILGTPEYMSPEQARGEGHDADARSDIYSLGVILYELLTGEKPFRGNQRMLLHQVLNEEPKSPRTLNDRIPRDLETISLKCMEKETAKRYQTAQEFADDLKRYLNNEPIVARPISRFSKILRWTKRKPAVASLSAAVVLTLLVGTAISTYFAIETNVALTDAKQANEKKDQALKEVIAANTKKDTALKKAIEANSKKDEAIGAKDAALKETRKTIDKYVETVQNAKLLKEERFKPLLKELLKDALEHYQRFIDQHEHKGSSLVDLGNALYRLAFISADKGDVDKAIEAYRSTIDIQQKLIKGNPIVSEYWNKLATCHNNIGLLYSSTGNPDQALLSHQKALEINEKLVKVNPMVTEYQNNLARSQLNIGAVYSLTEKLDEALLSYQKAIKITEKLVEENPTVNWFQRDLAIYHINLGALHQSMGKPDEALVSIQKALEIQEKLVEETPTKNRYQRDLAQSQIQLGSLLHLTRKPDESLLWYQKAIEITEKLVEENPTVTDYWDSLARIHNNVGFTYSTTRKPDEALMSYQKANEITEKLVEENPTVTVYRRGLALTHINIGNLYSSTGKPDEALLWYQKALEIRKKLVEENPTVTEYQKNLAKSYNNTGAEYASTGKPDEALLSFRKAIEVKEKLVDENKNSIQMAISLGVSYLNTAKLTSSQKDYENAAKYCEFGLETLGKVVKATPRHARARFFFRDTYRERALLMQNLERFDDAVADWEKAIEYDSGAMKAQLMKYRDAAAAKSKLQKQKKKSKPKKQSGIKKKKTEKNRNKPLIAPRPKLVAAKPRR